MQTESSVGFTDCEQLDVICKEVRRRTLQGLFHAQSGHPGSSLSMVEILTTLFFREMNTQEPLRDRFILSKGHGAPSFYAVLSLKGIISQEQLDTLRDIESPLQGHPVKGTLPFIDASTGSLGQGLSVGIGYALASKIKKEDRRVYVVLGDGELQEGQNWEAAMAGVKFQLENLLAIVDYNRYQNDGPVSETMPLESLKGKWESFGWHVQEVDGHNIEALLQCYQNAREVTGPSCIIAHTIKGRGVSLIEKNASRYCLAINEQEYHDALKELGEKLL